jgi:hypothetical protein
MRVRPSNQDRIRELLRHLDELRARQPQPHEDTVIAIAQDAIFDELGRLARAEGLTVFRSGELLDAVSMVG